ncbi:hypothetical protein CARUB_v10024189mg, partial [Capsella rubella]
LKESFGTKGRFVFDLRRLLLTEELFPPAGGAFLEVERSYGRIQVSLSLVLLQLDPFLNELTSMFEKSKEKGSVWVTLKRSSLKSKVQKRKLSSVGESIEYRCLIRATDGKKTVSTSVGAKDHQRFQASYATILKAHMTALKKRERKDRKKSTEAEKKEGSSTTKSKKL